MLATAFVSALGAPGAVAASSPVSVGEPWTEDVIEGYAWERSAPQLAGRELFEGRQFRDALAAAVARDTLTREHARSRSSRAARERSRTAFEALPPSDSLALARQQFGPLMTADRDSLRLRDGERVTGFPALNAATIVDNRGRRSLLLSSDPLAAASGDRLEAMDLSLQRTSGGYAPVSGASEVLLPQRADQFLTVEQSGFGIRPDNAQPTTATLSGNRLFYADIDVDTDYVATPTRAGAEVMWQLRSASSPEQLSLEYDLPERASIRLASELTTLARPSGLGDAEIVRDGEVLHTITAPLAFDASGRTLPASYRLRDGRLLVDVAHRGADVQYPVLVDPEVRDVWGAHDFLNTCGGGPTNFGPGKWSYGQTASFTPVCNEVHGGGVGIFIVSGAWHYVEGQTAYWKWGAPAGAYIADAWFDNLRHQAAGTYLYTGLTGSGYWGSLAYHPSEFLYGQYSQAPTMANRSWEAVVGLTAADTSTRPHIGVGGVRGVNLRLSDQDAPHVRLVGVTGGTEGGRTKWSDDVLTFNTATVNAIDAYNPQTGTGTGLGIHQLSVIRDGSGAVVGSATHGCAGHRSSRCPINWTATFPLYLSQLPQGENSLQTRALDIVGNPHTGPHWVQRIDRTAPEITISGDLVEHATDSSLPANPVIRIHARDGSPHSPSTQRSGVHRVRLLLDGVVREEFVAQNSCDSCDRVFEWSIPLSLLAGRHTVTVEAWDYVGHRASRDLTVVGQNPLYKQTEFELSCADYQNNAPAGEPWVCWDPVNSSGRMSSGLYEPTPEELAEIPVDTYDFPPEEAGDGSSLRSDDDDDVKTQWTWPSRRAHYGTGRITIGGVQVQFRNNLRGPRSHVEVVTTPFWGPAIKPEINIQCKWERNERSCSPMQRRYAPHFDFRTFAARATFTHRPYYARYYTNVNLYAYSLGRPGYRFHLKFLGLIAPSLRSPVFTCNPNITYVCTYD